MKGQSASAARDVCVAAAVIEAPRLPLQVCNEQRLKTFTTMTRSSVNVRGQGIGNDRLLESHR